jgi:hypothetical protein
MTAMAVIVGPDCIDKGFEFWKRHTKEDNIRKVNYDRIRMSLEGIEVCQKEHGWEDYCCWC